MNNKSINFIAILLALFAIYLTQDLVNPILMAFFITIIMVKPLKFLIEKKVPQGVAVTIIVTGLMAAYFLLIMFIGSSISNFIARAPEYAVELKEHTGSLAVFLDNRGISMDGVFELLDISKVMSFSADIAGSLGDSLSNVFTLILLTIFLLAEADVFSLKIKMLNESSAKSLKYLKIIGNSIRHYLSIKTMTSLATGVLVAIGLAVIGIDFPILWGFVAFLLNYIPNIGSILAAIPTMALAFVQLGMGGVIWTGVLYIIVNIVVGNVIEPKIMGKGLGLSTFVVFVALIFWGYVLGTVGMFLSVPITIALKIILEQNESTKPIAVFLGNIDDVKRNSMNSNE